jgi:SAM-dependent methyltransferase
MRADLVEPCDAYLFPPGGPDLEKFMQSNSLLTGPDEGRNRAVVELANRGPIVRTPVASTRVDLLEKADELFDFYPTLEALCTKAGRPVDVVRDNFGWKLGLAEQLMPARVLSIGCGNGDELIALRAAFPAAEIDAIDWEEGPSSQLLELVGARYRQGHILADRDERYDLIFSSHVLEHLYDPDRALAMFREWLRLGGHLVSALPMDGEADHMMRPRLEEWARAPGSVRGLDAGWLDVGHPWKTNPSDLSETLSRAGFESVSLYQRAHALSRDRAMDAGELDRVRSTGRRLNNLLRVLKTLAGPFDRARVVRKLALAVDMRLWFGDNRLKNLTAREVTFVAGR